MAEDLSEPIEERCTVNALGRGLDRPVRQGRAVILCRRPLLPHYFVEGSDPHAKKSSGILALALVFLKLVAGVPLHGTTALLLAVLFLGGVQLICLGILGEYIGRIYDEVRARPPFVVAAIVGETRLPPTTGEPQI